MHDWYVMAGTKVGRRHQGQLLYRSPSDKILCTSDANTLIAALAVLRHSTECAWRCLQVTLVDTAGLRESTDEIERLGMQRARSAMTSADIIAVVVDLQAEPELAAALRAAQQRAQGLAVRYDVASEDADESLAELSREFIQCVPGLPDEADADSLGARSQEQDHLAQRGRGSAGDDSNEAALRPKHQRTLLVLNKSDLQAALEVGAFAELLASPQSPPLSEQSSSSAASASSHAAVASAAPVQDSAEPALQSFGQQPDRSGGNAVEAQSTRQQDEGHPGEAAGAVEISCRTGQGLDRLLARLSRLVAGMTEADDTRSSGAIITR